MKIVNGTGKPVPFRANLIKNEASLDHGMTSIVFAHCDNGAEISISQHNAGEWDISVNENPESEWEEKEGDQAVAHFIKLVQQHNTEGRQ